MNWRMLGCGLVAAAIFVGIGLIGLWRAGAPAECPGVLPYEPDAYEMVGTPATEPRLDDVAGELERAGTTSFGLATWDVYVEAGRAPAASGDALPQRIVLACGDGTFQAYQRGAG